VRKGDWLRAELQPPQVFSALIGSVPVPFPGHRETESTLARRASEGNGVVPSLARRASE